MPKEIIDEETYDTTVKEEEVSEDDDEYSSTEEGFMRGYEEDGLEVEETVAE